MSQRQVAKNSMWNFAAQALLSVSNFILIPILILGLGKVGFGLFRTLSLFSITGYAALLELGLQSSVSKYTAQYVVQKRIERLHSLIGTSLIIFFAMGSVGLLIGLCGMRWWSTWFHVPVETVTDFNHSLVLIFLSYLVVFPMFAISGFLQGLQRFDVIRRVEISVQIVRVVLLIGLVKMGYGLSVIILANVLLQVVQFLVLLIASVTVPEFGLRGFSFDVLREIREFVAVNSVSKLYGLAFSQADILFLSLLLGPTVVAQYEIATKIPYTIKSTLGKVGEVLVPAASALYHQNRPGAVAGLFDKGVRLISILGYPVAVGLFIYAPEFLRMWVGAQDSPVILTFRWALALLVVYPPISVGGAMLLGTGQRLKTNVALSFVAQLINVVATWLLIPPFGIVGAVAATVGSFALLYFASLPLFIRYLKIRVKPLLLEPFKILTLSALVWLPARAVVGTDTADIRGATLCAWGIAHALVLAVILYFTVLDSGEKAYIYDILVSLRLRRRKQ